jgi:molecular chaperone GrpE
MAKKTKELEGRIRELEGALSKKEVELKENVSLMQRLQADFQNYMKHSEKERQKHAEKACDELLLEVVSVCENMELALRSIPQTDGNTKTIKGLNAVLRQTQKLLHDRGVRRIESLGACFDPAKHEAVDAIEEEGMPENSVVGEIQSGYLVRDRLLRPAKVIVARKKGG